MAVVSLFLWDSCEVCTKVQSAAPKSPREARDLSGMFTVPLPLPCPFIQLKRALYLKGDSCRRSEQALEQFIRR